MHVTLDRLVSLLPCSKVKRVFARKNIITLPKMKDYRLVIYIMSDYLNPIVCLKCEISLRNLVD